eukprot:3984603-Prymnesium_polylepis.2
MGEGLSGHAGENFKQRALATIVASGWAWASGWACDTFRIKCAWRWKNMSCCRLGGSTAAICDASKPRLIE